MGRLTIKEYQKQREKLDIQIGYVKKLLRDLEKQSNELELQCDIDIREKV